MDRTGLRAYIGRTYHTDPDCPWEIYPNYEVYRHPDNQKWFSVVMDVPKSKLGLSEDGSMTVMNLKCDPVLIGSLLSRPGFFPAYHMNKGSWITVSLDGSIPDEEAKILLDMSFALTGTKKKTREST